MLRWYEKCSTSVETSSQERMRVTAGLYGSLATLAERVIQLLERGAPRTELAFAKLVERQGHGVKGAVQVAGRLVDIEESGHDLAHGIARLHVGHRGDAVRRIVLLVEL